MFFEILFKNCNNKNHLKLKFKDQPQLEVSSQDASELETQVALWTTSLAASFIGQDQWHMYQGKL
jgi:allantoicase